MELEGPLQSSSSASPFSAVSLHHLTQTHAIQHHQQDFHSSFSLPETTS